MPRSRGGARPAPRPAPAPARSAAPQQSRQMTTAAHPPATAGQGAMQQKGVQQGQSPGLFGQMASTAA